LVVRVTAEDGGTADYTITITLGDGPSTGTWDLIGYADKTSISPTTVGMGQVLRVIFTCLNDGTGDLIGDEGEKVDLVFRYGDDVQFSDTLSLNKFIAKKPTGVSYTEFKKDVIIPTGLDVYGTNYTLDFVASGGTISKSLTIVKFINTTKTKVFSEKESLFCGNRNYLSPCMYAINNDLFASNPTNNREFYLMDSSLTPTLWGNALPEQWVVTFVVRVGKDAVLFKTLDIELGKATGGQVELLRIEYATNRQTSVQDPFYSATDTEWNPWNPVYKDESWHLPVKNEYDADALIPYKQMKGTYLRITLTGRNTDQIVLRGVMTKILKIFN